LTPPAERRITFN